MRSASTSCTGRHLGVTNERDYARAHHMILIVGAQAAQCAAGEPLLQRGLSQPQRMDRAARHALYIVDGGAFGELRALAGRARLGDAKVCIRQSPLLGANCTTDLAAAT